MSAAPRHPISFAQPDFFSQQEKKMLLQFGGNEEGERKPFYKRYWLVILVTSILFVVLAIVLIVLGATGSLGGGDKGSEVVPSPSQGSNAMALHEAGTKQEMAGGSGDIWSLVDPSQHWGLNGPLKPSLTTGVPTTFEPVEPVEPVEFVEPVPPPESTIVHSTSFTLSGEGEGTFYSPGVGLGACGAQNGDAEFVAALNIEQFGGYVNPADSPACGACINITGPKGSINVKVVDKCPGCKHGDMDLSPVAFEQIADMAAGRVKIAWSPC